jgi:hypothetical protein
LTYTQSLQRVTEAQKRLSAQRHGVFGATVDSFA